MTKAQYRQARKLIRETGWYDLNGLTEGVKHTFTLLKRQHRDDLADKEDLLAHKESQNKNWKNLAMRYVKQEHIPMVGLDRFLGVQE